VLTIIPDSNHIQQVCKPGCGSPTCRWLQTGDLAGDKTQDLEEGRGCAKGVASWGKVMESNRFVQVAKGDNCTGSPDFIPTTQSHAA